MNQDNQLGGNQQEDSLDVEGTQLEDTLVVEDTQLEDILVVEGMPQVVVGKPQVGTHVHHVLHQLPHEQAVKKFLCQIHHGACPCHLPSFRKPRPGLNLQNTML